MSKRAGLWVGFAAVHLVVGVLGFLLGNQPMGDVYNVYEPWSGAAISGWGIVGITLPWVYPQLALLPMLAAEVVSWSMGAWPWAYTVAWAIVVTVIDAVVFALLVGRGTSAGRRTAAWFWLIFTLLIGPVVLYRIDGVTVALAIAGCLWLVGRPWLGAAVLAVATWMKVWPAALLAAALIAIRRRLAVLGGAAVVSAVVVGFVVSLGGATHLFGFIGDQATRGLQIEAPVSAYYLWRAAFGLPGSFVFWDRAMLTFQVTGPGVDGVITVMTPILVVAVLSVAVIGLIQNLRGATFARLFTPLSLGLVLAFIVFNKVGSPQYIAWLIPPLAIGLLVDRRRWLTPGLLALGIALLTQIVYPVTYDLVTAADPVAVSILTVRNILLVGLFVWTVVLLVRIPVRSRPRRARDVVVVSA